MSSEVREGPPVLGTMKNVGEILKSYEERFASVLPKGSNVTRFMRGALDCVAKSKGGALLQCTVSSFISSVMQSASLGLCIDSVVGES